MARRKDTIINRIIQNTTTIIILHFVSPTKKEQLCYVQNCINTVIWKNGGCKRAVHCRVENVSENGIGHLVRTSDSRSRGRGFESGRSSFSTKKNINIRVQPFLKHNWHNKHKKIKPATKNKMAGKNNKVTIINRIIKKKHHTHNFAFLCPPPKQKTQLFYVQNCSNTII